MAEYKRTNDETCLEVTEGLQPVIQTLVQSRLSYNAFAREARMFSEDIERQILANCDIVISTDDEIHLGEVRGMPQKYGEGNQRQLVHSADNNYQCHLEDLHVSEALFEQGILIVSEYAAKTLSELPEEGTLDAVQIRKFVKILQDDLLRLKNHTKHNIHLKERNVKPPTKISKILVLNVEKEKDPDSFGAHYYTKTQQIPSIGCKNDILKVKLKPLPISQESLNEVSEKLNLTGIKKIIGGILDKVRRVL